MLRHALNRSAFRGLLPRVALFPVHWQRIAVLGLLLLTLLSTGCRIIQTAADAPSQTLRAVTPGKRPQPSADPVEVQQVLLRFADGFLNRMLLGVDQLQRGTNRLDPTEALSWKIALTTETCAVAAGPNAVANLLDMTIMVTVSRMTQEKHCEPTAFADSARPMLESCRIAETEIWQLAGLVLNTNQQRELHESIEAWYQLNPSPNSALAAHGLGFASRVAGASTTGNTRSEGVFSLLRMDPFAGMDPAVREIAQTRMFAERALFVTQKMPMLLRWQTELLSLNAAGLPEVQQVVANSTQIAASVDRFAAVAENLPSQLSAERAAIVTALEAQEKEIALLMTSGTRMSDSLNMTLTTFDSLLQRFGVGDTNHIAQAATNAQPFRIQDYTATAAQLQATAERLTELLLTLDQTLGSTNLLRFSAQVAPVVQQAQAGGREVVDYAFAKGVLLVLIMLAAALIHRFLSSRLFPDRRKTAAS